MEKRKRVLELRDRLDRTLALPDLSDEASLRELVKKQILASALPGGSEEGDIDLIAEARAKEVSEFLESLNTSSDGQKVHGTAQKEWKVKQDTDQLRVMYCEGPEGTPFHTLLLEGFADGPLDVCTCVSWEASLYRKWFPQYNLPTFKIDEAGCLKKVRIGEEISLVRVKVPWPVSEREALLHYFALEYLKEDLVIVIMKTISDLDSIDTRTHGFCRDGIPEAGDVVRIDVFGGFVLQRITKEKSFFRTIANMDMKLDFVPPWLINFISRQLVGSGHKLYQKAISTAASSDEDYKKALKAQLYVRIREYRDFDNKVEMNPAEENANNEILPENPTAHNLLAVTNITSNSEIVEEDDLLTGPHNQPTEQQVVQVENKPFFSPEVEQALGILDAAIAVLRGNRTNNISNLQNLLSYDATLEDSNVSSKSSQTCLLNSDHLLKGSPTREIQETNVVYDEKVNHRVEDGINDVSLQNSTASTMAKTMPTALRNTTQMHGEESLNTNGFYQDGIRNNKESSRPRKYKSWLCCLPRHGRQNI